MERITDFIQNFNGNPWVIFLGFFVGIVGGVYGYITAKSNKRKKEITYTYYSNVLVQNGKEITDGIKISFNERRVKNITATKIAIWNSGNKSIKKDDFVKSIPFKIFVDNDAEILDAKIIAENEPCNNIKIQSKTSKELVLDLEYLDSKNGAVFQIIHTGNSCDIKVSCKLIDGKDIINQNKKMEENFRKNNKGYKELSLRAHTILLMISFGILVALIGVKLFLSSTNTLIIVQNKILFAYSILCALFFVILFAASIGAVNAMLPKGLRCFSKNDIWVFFNSMN